MIATRGAQGLGAGVPSAGASGFDFLVFDALADFDAGFATPRDFAAGAAAGI